MSRKLFSFLTLTVIAIFSLFAATACGVDDVQKFFDSSNPQKQLDAPTGLRIESGSLCWNPVEYATKYTVSIDGREDFSEDYKYSISNVKDGEHIFKVKANGDGVLYTTSAYSAELIETIQEGAKVSTGYYGKFDELTKNESFLGYGFDVINSSVFSDKYIRTSSPLFKTEELMKQRLVKVDSKYSTVEEIQSSELSEFMSRWNASAKVKVDWEGLFTAGTVAVEANYSGGVDNAASKYYHVISIVNQKFYIVLQSDIETYKSILTDGFMKDLYSETIDPATLFDRYGTHFITSAVMGGKINSYYLYSSTENKSYHDISTSVSVDVRTYFTNTNVNVSGGYRQQASNENIYIENKLEVIGGDDFGMLSDADIPKNYIEWEKSLNDHASLMGIKDPGSLIPIWDLCDSSNEIGKTYYWDYGDGNGPVAVSRAAQLQAYFNKYGIDSYNSLMKNAGLREIKVPTEITNIKINGNSEKNGEYEVFAGADNDVSFTVLPEDALGYTKKASISANTDYAEIVEEKGRILLRVSPECKDREILQLTLSAGSIRKQITLRVAKQYTVTFETNFDDIVVEPYRNIREGRQIEAPALPAKKGYIFKGWYTDPDFTEGSEYKFGNQAIKGNITLYAKWEKYYPTVTYIHNMNGCDLTEQKVEYNTALVVGSYTPINGYHVEGYYSDSEMMIPFDFTQKLIIDTVVYVKWETNKYSVTLNANGGTVTDKQIADYRDIPFKSWITTPQAPERDGYTFVGWYKDKNFTNEFIEDEIEEDFTLYAKWEKYYPTITVIHNIDERENDVYKCEYNKTYTLPKNLTEYGYTFKGYYADAEKLIAFDESTKFTKDTAIYAKWDKNTYTVTFNSNGGTQIDSQKVNYKELAQKPENPTKLGATFSCWCKDVDCKQSFDFHNDLITKDITLYAYFTVNGIEIEFNTDGGNEIEKVGIEAGKSLGEKLRTPEKAGYTFKGWYVGDTRIYSNTVLYENATLTAKWEANTYTVKYNANGSSGNMGNQTFTYDVAQKLNKNNFVKTGYTFIGWTKVSGATAVDYTDEISVKNLIDKGDITLYAVWQANTYIVKFNANGGSGSISNQTFTYDVAQKLNKNNFVKTGYTFIGWAKVSGATSIDYTNEVSVKNLTTKGEIVLYAVWKANTYTVKFNANGGSGNMGNQTFIYDEAQKLNKNNFVKTGYTFIGWATVSGATSIDYTNEVLVKNLTAKSEIVLYAVWQANTYIVKFNANGGSGSMGDQTFTYDEKQSLSKNYYFKQDYLFLGWAKNNAAITPDYTDNQIVINLLTSGDINLYAVWEQKYINFGSYPQSEVTDSTLKTMLDNLAGALPQNGSNKKWTSYKYYIEDNNSTDYMWYQDILYNGEKYRGVYFTSYRPDYTFGDSSDTKQEYLGYYINNIYWFKFEPIKWRIIEKTTSEGKTYATILCEKMIDCQHYSHLFYYDEFIVDGRIVYENNYEYSDIRAWLNNEFYITAFNSYQQELIQTIKVDNGARSTYFDTFEGDCVNEYAWDDTYDKVWLLSCEEATKSTYGFNTDDPYNPLKWMKSTAYATCQGCSTYWLLRSPAHSNRGLVCVASPFKDLICHHLNNSILGVVPALKICLED
ncbi:MAG: InlB B-repeat-containing protein [Clostridia bacterium]|nr:InlB B-repeat-containing protein [Clostridia bacterium]